ncbi:hypothetical protein WGU94_10380, partial [Campylobacter jejuni]
MRSIRTLFDRMSREERQLLIARDAQQQRSIQTFWIVLTLAGITLVGFGLASLLVVVRYTTDLTTSREQLQ